MEDDMTPERHAVLSAVLHASMNTFADEIIKALADTLTTETAYELLHGLTYEEWSVVIRKVLTGSIGRLN
jgi:Fe2+ or Zn2+ uptake regulation protein